MNVFKYFLGLILLISFTASNSFSQNNNILFTAGMYKSANSISGNSCNYLKFFDDKTVLKTFSYTTKETPEQVEKRLTKFNALKINSSISIGKYYRLGNKAYCTFQLENGEQTYIVDILDQALIMNYGKPFPRQQKYTHWIKLKPITQTRPNTNSNSINSSILQSLSLGNGFSPPKVYAVIVGVAKYNHINSLNYTDDDAYKIYAYLKSPEGGALTDDQVSILVDEVATRDNILRTMRSVFSKAGPNDLILFYFSGHGEDGSFLPSDFNGYNYRLTHSSVRDIFDQSRAKHKICIADACFSGSLDKGVKAGWAGVYDNYYTALRSSKGGLALFMSSKAEETSLEIGGLRQSIFTYYMLQGLKGQADVNRNKVVTIQELYNYVTIKVKAYTKNRQSPVIHGNYDRNMPVGVIR